MFYSSLISLESNHLFLALSKCHLLCLSNYKLATPSYYYPATSNPRSSSATVKLGFLSSPFFSALNITLARTRTY